MKIFIDIDNIIADFENAFRNFLNKKLNKKLKKDDMREYEFYKCFKVDKLRVEKLHKEFIEKKGYEKLKPVKGSKEAIRRLREFCEVKYITSRNKKTWNATFNWFKLNKIPINNESLIFSRDKLFYSPLFGLIIEDKWEEATRLAKNNKIVILFDYPWNRKEDENNNLEIHKNIIRVNNWEEAVKFIKNIAH